MYLKYVFLVTRADFPRGELMCNNRNPSINRTNRGVLIPISTKPNLPKVTKKSRKRLYEFVKKGADHYEPLEETNGSGHGCVIQ